jgi:ParB family transcriptional regulator, chromosome partitioning protein
MRRSVAVESVSPPVSSVMTGTFQELPITDIHESALLTNPRATFDQAALDELAASIRLRGVLQPILVRPRTHDSGYELIAGARRLRASRLAQIATIPAHVVAFDDQAAREAAIIENLQRQDVHPLEEAEAYERLMAEDTLVTADTIAAKVGKSATYVYARLTLLRLQPDIRDAFRRDIITAAHAQRLATTSRSAGGGFRPVLLQSAPDRHRRSGPQQPRAHEAVGRMAPEARGVECPS